MSDDATRAVDPEDGAELALLGASELAARITEATTALFATAPEGGPAYAQAQARMRALHEHKARVLDGEQAARDQAPLARLPREELRPAHEERRRP